MNLSTSSTAAQKVEVSGHIIDSLILSKVMDCIKGAGGSFQVEKCTIGEGQHDPSYALLSVEAPTQEKLEEILKTIAVHGAISIEQKNCQIVSADIAGAFPEGFYSTTNQKTEVRIDGEWIEVQNQEMDCGIVIDLEKKLARCLPMTQVKEGDQLVVGHGGVQMHPQTKTENSHTFEFMNSAVSTEKPKGIAIRQIATELYETKKSGKKALIVGGPAIVHTGSVEHLSKLLRGNYFSRLFAGNALATHDIEQAFFGTSLGVSVSEGDIIESGHEHHLRSINRIRRAGSIANAVEKGLLTSGIMYECVQNGIDFTLAGSIRDDGPLPDVITDALEAQQVMRDKIADISFCLMVATNLHSIAVGNLLPAWIKVVCVDINPSTVIKLNDRGSFQTIGLVTDVEPFLRSLVSEVEALEAADAI
ncbi:MAG: TIGR00300 family protein [Pirellulaceae bacterium]|nr:TIGR00300 family protein [Pirellulaceae bacterium]